MTSNSNHITLEETSQANLSYDDLYVKYHREVYLAAWKFLGSTQEAEDATQEVFISLWRSFDTIIDERHAKNWLFRSIRNKCIDTLRSWRRRLSNISVVFEERLDHDYSYETDYTRVELEERIQELLSLVRPVDREVLIANFNADGSYTEASTSLGQSYSTYKERLFRARRRINRAAQELAS